MGFGHAPAIHQAGRAAVACLGGNAHFLLMVAPWQKAATQI
jgi:hypothetical protein